MNKGFTYGYKTDTGRQRAINEDACGVLPADTLFVVADGVGGGNAGESASRTAVSTISGYLVDHCLYKTPDADLPRLFGGGLEEANRSVRTAAASHIENQGMATTLLLCHLRKDKAWFVNVGDSRGYIFAEDELLQITEDHSYVNELVRVGILTKEEAAHDRRSNVITRAIGAEHTVEGDLFEAEIREGDIILLCTDGLYGELEEEEIVALMREETQMQRLAERLVQEANRKGGKDNITAITIKIEKGDLNE